MNDYDRLWHGTPPDDVDHCIECGKEMTPMDTNFGTIENLVCINCYSEAQAEIKEMVIE